MKLLTHIFKKLNQLLWVFTDKVGFLILALILNIFVTRYLGKKEYGQLSYILALSAFFAFIYEMGLRTLLVKEFLDKNISRDKVLNNSLFLRFIGFGIAFSVIYVYLHFSEKDQHLRWLTLIFSLTIFFSSFNCIEALFYSDSFFKQLIRFRFVFNIFLVLSKLVLVLIKAPFYWFLIAYGSDVVINGILYVFLIRKHYPHLSFGIKFIDKKVLIYLLKQGFPFMVAASMVIIYMKIDVLMLKLLTNVENVALYSITVKFSEIYYFIPVAVATYYFPNLVKLKEIDEDMYKKKMQEQFDVLVLIALTICFFTLLFSGVFIKFIYGPSFMASADALKIHILGGFFVFWGVARARVLIIEDLQRLVIFTEFTCALTNVILNIYLIPRYGIMGASAATVLTYFIGDYLVSYFFKSLKPYTLMLNRSFKNIITLRVFRTIRTVLTNGMTF